MDNFIWFFPHPFIGNEFIFELTSNELHQYFGFHRGNTRLPILICNFFTIVLSILNDSKYKSHHITSIENTVSSFQLELMTFCVTLYIYTYSWSVWCGSCRVGCWVGKVVGIFWRENEKTQCDAVSKNCKNVWWNKNEIS